MNHKKSRRSSIFTQSDASRLFKAARSAGYGRARLIGHPDGRIELIGEDASDGVTTSPSEDLDRELAEFEERHGQD